MSPEPRPGPPPAPNAGREAPGRTQARPARRAALRAAARPWACGSAFRQARPSTHRPGLATSHRRRRRSAADLAAPCAGEDGAARLEAFLGPDADPAAFWAMVEANPRAGRMRLVIVADRIPPELARFVELPTARTLPGTEVLAVELRWFEAGDGRLTLAPRTIGATEAVKARKTCAGRHRLNSVPGWLDAHFAADTPAHRGADAWVALMEELGATLRVASTGGSIMAFAVSPGGRSAYAFGLHAEQRVILGLGANRTRGALADRDTRQGFFDRFSEVVGRLSTTADGYLRFPSDRLADPATLAAFRAVAHDWVAACVKAADTPEASPC